ncbi:microtubule-associated protein futsch-like [Dermacentor albipictus]|uniref:microtubule-associated protein futsch-like n=1 Tax=Dermacentor albipictus TaxID=60249 RepID=UPI0031FC51A2
MARGANGQRVTRSRTRRQKAVTSTISGGIQQNVHTGEHSVQQNSDQQDLLDSAVTKTTRSNRQGKKVQIPEGSAINKSRDTGITPPARFHPSQSTKTEETNMAPPTEKRKTRKKLSPATSGSKAVRSSNRLGTRKKPSSEKEALGGNTFKESRHDIQTNASALKRQQISDNVRTDSRKSTLQASLGDSETSTLVCERNRERKRTAQAFPHHESSEEGEGASAQPPIERKKSKGKRPLSKASNAEAVPSSSKAKTTVTRSSSQEEQSLRGVASKQVRQDVQTSGHASNEQHTLDNSNTRSLRSRKQAYGRANPQAGRPVPEGAGRIASLRDAEASRPVCERNAKRKKTAEALRHHEPSEKGESTSARPPTEKRKSKEKQASSEASNAEAASSSSRAKTILTRSSSQEEQSFWGVASKQVRQDVQTSGHASNEQHALDNSNSRSLRSRNQAYGRANPQARRPVPEGAGGIASLRDAEASRPVCERNAKRKKTAEALRHHEPSEKGESTSAQPPTEKRKSKEKQPSSEASNAEAAPSSSRAKTILTRSSSQEEQSFWGVASKQVRQDVQTSGHASNEQHTLDNSNSRSLRSRNQAYGRANPQAGRPVPEGAGGIASLRDAEASRPVYERNAKRKKTAEALHLHEPSEKGESTSAQPPTEKRKSKKKWHSSEASNAEAVPSSSRAKTILTRSSSQEEKSFWGVASKQVRQDVQTSGHASNEQHTLDNSNSRSLRSRNQAYGRANPQAGRPVPEGASLRDAETSILVCERKKTAQASRHEPSKKGESISAQPPTEKRKSKEKQPSSEASNAETVPSSSRAKTAMTRSSSQKEQSSWGVASKKVRQDVQTSGHTSNEEHTLSGSLSFTLRSINQADGRANPRAGRSIPESAAGTTSQPPQPFRHKMDREKLRARPRHHPKRKFAHEPIFVLEDTQSSHRTTLPSSRDEVDASLPLSPIPVSTLPEAGHAGKLGFHWYEATFGALREHTKLAELERSDDDIESLHWVSDTEWPTDAHQTEDDDSSDVSSDDDFTLPWDEDRLGFSGQSSRDQEPGPKTEGLDHWQKDARRRVQAYLPGVRVTKRAWETIYQWQDHFLKNMGESLEAMAQRVGHDRIEEEDVVWYIHRYLGTADPYKLWALANELLPAELLQRLYPATPCLLSSKSPE